MHWLLCPLSLSISAVGFSCRCIFVVLCVVLDVGLGGERGEGGLSLNHEQIPVRPSADTGVCDVIDDSLDGVAPAVVTSQGLRRCYVNGELLYGTIRTGRPVRMSCLMRHLHCKPCTSDFQHAISDWKCHSATSCMCLIIFSLTYLDACAGAWSSCANWLNNANRIWCAQSTCGAHSCACHDT